jgi:hypothetical protein
LRNFGVEQCVHVHLVAILCIGEAVKEWCTFVREGFFLEECLGGVRTSAVRSAPCGGLWQAVLVISVAVAQRGEHFCAGWGFKKRHKSQIFIATSAPHALWGSARTSTCTQHVSIFR